MTTKRYMNVARCLIGTRYLSDDAPVPDPDDPDPYGLLGTAMYDEQGLVSVEWNEAAWYLKDWVDYQTEHDPAIPMEDRVPLKNWQRD